MVESVTLNEQASNARLNLNNEIKAEKLELSFAFTFW